MFFIDDFINKLYIYLTGKENNSSNIIRVHTRKLQESGELSFPLKIGNWCSLIGKNDRNDTIFNLLSETEGEDVNKLVTASQSWSLSVDKCEIIKDNVYIYLNRTSTFKAVIRSIILDNTKNYGAVLTCKDLKFSVKCDDLNNDSDDIKLSELRLKLLTQIAKNIVQFCGGIICDNDADFNIVFSVKSSKLGGNCLCGAVLNTKGVKEIVTTAKEFYEQRTLDMREMAEHKYGNKPNQTVTTDINNEFLSSRKGAAFILYNCARLATLFKEFDKKVSQNVYPKLPELHEIDFGLLNEMEEWELLYIHILQFPCVIKNCIKDVFIGKIYPNFVISALSGMSLCFSVYYRRVKILIEPRDHIYARLHARIYLLKALEQVMHNGLRILDIEPVKQM
ncbi:dalrd3 protein [Holotrichia oblita]|uniref:Dalrd3 protein n=1 Tax=Holotrichia oblita TaxID=644536 RepID=A0ACB9SVY2_HOLOL|nr:dalrd3 protein [Holotrichia oblita]